MNAIDTHLSRRSVLAGLGGLTFCLVMGADGVRLVTPAQAEGDAALTGMSPWVRLSPDGTITILTAGAEMGQGSMTSLPLILADEMDADWDKVKLEWAPADAKTYGYKAGNSYDMSIVGSRAVMSYFDDLRMAGAQVRKILLLNAAEKWDVDPATLKTEPSVVVDPASGRRLTYGEIASFAKIPSPIPTVEKTALKTKAEWRYIGKDIKRRDIAPKVQGAAQFSIDVVLPGMAYASALHSPVHGGEAESWNDDAVRAMKGVIATVKIEGGIGVVADTFPHAMAARRALKVKWKDAEAVGFDSGKAMDNYAAVLADPAAKKEPVDQKGDADAAFATAAKVYRANYRSDYSYHAQMEPLNAVARFDEAGDHVEVWEGSQAPNRSRTLIAKTLGFKESQVTHHQCYMGGGFGRRSLGDYAAEAAVIARAIKRPVKLVWTREEDIAHGMFRPQCFQSLEAATDTGGKVTGWRHSVVGDGGVPLLAGGVKIIYYGVPNQDIAVRGQSHGVRIKQWRGVAHNFNLFAIESFVDHMAAEQGMDPIAFRIEKMAMIPKARRCFEEVAKMCDWSAKRPEGRALGIAISERSGSLGAGVVELGLNRETGKLRVHKIWMAIDGGTIVQPEAAKANVESGIVYGLSNVLHERVTLKDGVVEQSNFNDYTVLRMSDMPELMEVKFLPSDGRPTGLGEMGTPFVMPAVANAFFKLTGKRLYHMPFTPDKVKEALA
jgi:isoquinoline 1-oxidoreductase beta subunit